MTDTSNEAQMKALNDMKKRFQGLIETYEISNTELEDELKSKIDALSAMQVENEDLNSQLRSAQSALNRVSEECNTQKKLAHSRQQAALQLRLVIGKL